MPCAYTFQNVMLALLAGIMLGASLVAFVAVLTIPKR